MNLRVAPARAQQPATPAAQPAAPAAPAPPVAPATKTTGTTSEPDYPDPRTPVIGIYYLRPFSSPGPDIIGGGLATAYLTPYGQAVPGTYETLRGLGNYNQSPLLKLGYPVTRTGMVYVDIGRINGAGNHTVTQDVTLNTYAFVPGDYLVDSFRLNYARIYLDDLLFPHKFPVSRLRFKSIWAFQYLGVYTVFESPTEDAAAYPTLFTSNSPSDHNLYLPEFGLAMEYALARHALFRVDAAGFGLPHKADLGEANATLSVRSGKLEITGGVKMLHFKTSPSQEEYLSGTIVAAFAGISFHIF